MKKKKRDINSIKDSKNTINKSTLSSSGDIRIGDNIYHITTYGISKYIWISIPVILLLVIVVSYPYAIQHIKDFPEITRKKNTELVLGSFPVSLTTASKETVKLPPVNKPQSKDLEETSNKKDDNFSVGVIFEGDDDKLFAISKPFITQLITERGYSVSQQNDIQLKNKINCRIQIITGEKEYGIKTYSTVQFHISLNPVGQIPLSLSKVSDLYTFNDDSEIYTLYHQWMKDIINHFQN